MPMLIHWKIKVRCPPDIPAREAQNNCLKLLVPHLYMISVFLYPLGTIASGDKDLPFSKRLHRQKAIVIKVRSDNDRPEFLIFQSDMLAPALCETDTL